MIDVHSHILFGLDDGAQNPEDMMAMAKQAVADGITTVVATPHHLDHVYTNPPEKIIQRLEEANALLKEHQIPLTLLPGMEIHVYGEVPEDLKNNQLLSFNDQHRHILLELPHDHVPRYLEKLIFQIQLAGYIPIIPHPERNKEMRENPNLLYRLVKQGALSQLTAASVTGKFGKKIQKSCFDMINHHLVHFIASDAHNTGSRGVILSEAYETVKAKFGQEYVDWFQDSAKKIITGKECQVHTPEKIRKKFLGLF
ncbi:tyrosine-protein phosphatase [Ammoniphilus sp. CFH 90114]|uniref:tyrosine-protein phosphatase n=1 Tax=Ammoniphilus sp. CFH 90114 TaxID=2493665 RepID=UPI00100EDD26|nr:CpsB/CapC family capsule biosynthesis tyrosine phosphatase [Ammoniphilus sp. CFH 90114]RXT03683.1 tyrosine protein phosphatase [Ammoniphilus sp. CFH 90114]